MAIEAIPGNAGRADYPRMLYHADGRFLVVQNPEQHQAQLEKGFSQNPQPQHQVAPIVKNPVGGDSMQDIMRAAVEKVLDERGLTKAWARDVSLFLAVQTSHPGELPQLELPSTRSK